MTFKRTIAARVEKSRTATGRLVVVKRAPLRQGTAPGRNLPGAAPLMTPIAKVDKALQVIFGVVLDPYIVDAHDDWCPPGAIEETAHRWLTESRKAKLQHESALDAVPVESWIQPYPTPDDRARAHAGEPHRIWKTKLGTEWVHSGSWVLGMRVLDPAAWAQVLSGELDAYSIGGFGMRREIERVPMPEIEVLTVEAPP